jgi:hypothetical protein
VAGPGKIHWGSWAITLGIWILIVWLLYPLFTPGNIHALKAKEYLYRAAFGIMLMIILLGRNVFDMFMPQAYSKKIPAIQSVLLVLYSLLIAGTIIFMVARVIELYVGNALSEANF